MSERSEAERLARPAPAGLRRIACQVRDIRSEAEMLLFRLAEDNVLVRLSSVFPTETDSRFRWLVEAFVVEAFLPIELQPLPPCTCTRPDPNPEMLCMRCGGMVMDGPWYG